MKVGVLSSVLIQLLNAGAALGYAYLFASEAYCSVNLIVGSTIMGSEVQDGNPRVITVSRGSQVVSNGSAYYSSEVLTVNLSYVDVQYAYEVTTGTAVFQNGACNGNRLANTVGQLVMPESGDVVLIAGSASHFGGLSLTTPFTLVVNTSVNSSTVITTTAPQQEPPHYPTWHEMSQSTQIIIGLVVGVMGLSLAVILLYCCVSQVEVLTTHSRSLAKIPAGVGILLALTSVGLVSSWAQDRNNSTDDSFLGLPSWRSNIFAWHPVLMVGGFFAAQVVAISLWSFDTPPAPGDSGSGSTNIVPNQPLQPEYLVSAPSSRIKLVHVFFQCAAMGCLIAGLVAIVQTTFKYSTPSLTSLHSWYGVAAVALFGTNFVFGLFMSLLTLLRPRSVLHRAFNLLATHRVLGLSALAFTVMAIGSGIMTELPADRCYYNIGGDQSFHDAQVNPALAYPLLKDSCKIANGLGLTVALAAAATAVGAVMHANRQTRNSVTAEVSRQATEAAAVPANAI